VKSVGMMPTGEHAEMVAAKPTIILNCSKNEKTGRAGRSMKVRTTSAKVNLAIL
jgi:hypothetical protein